MDAFFAAIEELDSPQFRGLPIVVGADPQDGHGRGVVSTANYAARKYGIHSAMPITRAWRLSEKARLAGQPGCVFLPVNMRRYAGIFNNIMEIIRSEVPVIEQTSVDEAYLDLTFTGSFAKAKKLAIRLKKGIKTKEHLTASVGIGPNKLVAKIASDLQKPDGLTVIQPEEAEKVLAPLAIRKIPGIGPKTEASLQGRGVKTVGDLKKFSEAELYELFGKWGLELYEKVRGHDQSPLATEWEAKSIGEQETFPEDTDRFSYVNERVAELCKSVAVSVQKEGFKTFKRVVLTVRFDNFKTKTKSKTLEKPTASVAVLRREILNMLLPFFDHRENPEHRRLRLVGVRVEKLE